MRVVRLVVYRVRMPLKVTFTHSRASRTEADNVLVEAATDTGVSGFGEGVPREYVTGETPESALEYLGKSDYSFLSAGWDSLGEAVRSLCAWETAEAGNGPVFPGAARCALSLGLLDAVGKAWGCGAGEAVSAGRSTRARAEVRDRVRYSAVCSGGEPRAVALSCAKYRLYGFKAVKIKVGWGEERDVALVRTARRVLGRRVDVRVDANGAWGLGDALRVIPRLEVLGVSSVEEPLAPRDRDKLPGLRRAVRMPVMLDESLRSRADLARLAAAGACDLVNIRLSKCGGIFASLALADEARAAGIGCQMGCQVGESGILSAAGRHFAFLCPDARHLEGSYDRHLLGENLTVEDITFGYGGRALRLSGPGLGVTVDRRVLDRYTVEKREIAL